MNEWKTVKGKKPTIENLVKLRKSQGRFYTFKIKNKKIMQRKKTKEKYYSPEQRAKSQGWKTLHWVKEYKIGSSIKAQNLMEKIKNPKFEYRYFETYAGSEMAFMKRRKRKRKNE